MGIVVAASLGCIKCTADFNSMRCGHRASLGTVLGPAQILSRTKNPVTVLQRRCSPALDSWVTTCSSVPLGCAYLLYCTVVCGQPPASVPEVTGLAHCIRRVWQ